MAASRAIATIAPRMPNAMATTRRRPLTARMAPPDHRRADPIDSGIDGQPRLRHPVKPPQWALWLIRMQQCRRPRSGRGGVTGKPVSAPDYPGRIRAVMLRRPSGNGVREVGVGWPQSPSNLGTLLRHVHLSGAVSR